MKSTYKPVTGSILIKENHMSRLLASEITSVSQHIFKDISVSDFGPDYIDALFFTHSEESRLLITVATTVSFLSLP